MADDRQHDRRAKIGSVLVVGAGIGGMQAALDLANAGLHVTLVEQTTAIGGRMAQLDKTFPTNDCSMCTISPKLIEVDKHLNVDVVTNADVVGLEGEPGDFRVKVRKRPRYVDLDKCNACGDCVETVPRRGAQRVRRGQRAPQGDLQALSRRRSPARWPSASSTGRPA